MSRRARSYFPILCALKGAAASAPRRCVGATIGPTASSHHHTTRPHTLPRRAGLVRLAPASMTSQWKPPPPPPPSPTYPPGEHKGGSTLYDALSQFFLVLILL